MKACDGSTPALGSTGIACPDPQPKCPPPFGGTLPQCTFTPDYVVLGIIDCNNPPCTVDPNGMISIQCTLPPIHPLPPLCAALPPVICDAIQTVTAQGISVAPPSRAP